MDNSFKKTALQASKETLIQAELVKNLYQQWRSVLLGVITTATGVAALFYNEVPHTTIFTWLLGVYLLSFIRHLSVRKFRSQDREALDIVKWGGVFALFAFLSGLIWGVASMIFFDQANLQLFNVLSLIIIAMSVGSLAALSSHPFSYYVFVFPAMLPIIWRYLNIDAPGYNIFGWLMLVFLFALFSFSRVNYKTLRESVELRFQNVDLIQQLIAQKDVAEQANVAKTKFLAAASHDLRQPLYAIGLFLGALNNKIEKEDQKAIVTKIQTSTDALNGLLDSLLDVSKLDAGIIQVEHNTFSISDLFNSLKNEFEASADEKNLRLKFVDTRLWVNSDYRILERITRNLISNAIRYTNQGGIVVGCRRINGKILLAVYDTGIGIEKDKMESIFNEFYQIDNQERDRSKGLGLGLAIVKRMAKLLSTPLFTTSILGRGSMFGLQIQESTLSNPVKTVASPLGPPPAFFDNKVVLIVDDEQEIRAGLSELLRGWHCEVIAVASGEEALKANYKKPPDIILADYRLRNNETGNDVIKKVKALFPNEIIPAVIITGDTAPDRIKEAEASGFELLHKPVSPSELQVLLGKVLCVDSRA